MVRGFKGQQPTSTWGEVAFRDTTSDWHMVGQSSCRYQGLECAFCMRLPGESLQAKESFVLTTSPEPGLLGGLGGKRAEWGWGRAGLRCRKKYGVEDCGWREKGGICGAERDGAEGELGSA